VASARLAEAHLLFSLRDFDQAVAILSEQEASLQHTDHAETHARVLMNLGYAYWQNGKMFEGARYYEAAIGLFKELGITTEAARIQWAFARMLRDAGQTQEALKRFGELTVEFDRVGMTCEAALVGLDVAELILEDQRFAEVEEISVRAMRAFELAGVSYTAKALTALGYMREATRNRTATPKLVRHVRDFIRRLPAEEKLLFVPL
jgi:tetratricopeptide (TPR) repeat protein